MWSWYFKKCLGLSRAPSSELELEHERTLAYVKPIEYQLGEKIMMIAMEDHLFY